MATHVYIATTAGPVAVQGFLPDFPQDVPSLICKNGESVRLAISNAYDEFVAKGSGVIEEEFGDKAYRLDISHDNVSGDSWLLPVYIAHYLHSLGVLGNGEPKAGDKVIWASGKVIPRDRLVSLVHGVPEKLIGSEELFETLLRAGIPTMLLLPSENVQILDVNDVSWRRNYEQAHRKILAVDSLKGVKESINGFLGIGSPRSGAIGAQAGTVSRHYFGLKAVFAAASILVIAGVLYAVANGLGLIEVEPGRGADTIGMEQPVASAGGLLQQEKSTTTASAVQTKPLGDKAAHDDFENVEALDRESRRKAWEASEAERVITTSKLIIELAQSTGNCDPDNTLEWAASPADFRYPPVPLDRLCGLSIEPADDVHGVIGVALDTGARVPVSYSGGTWDISLPSQSDRARSYALLMLQNVTTENAAQVMGQIMQRQRPQAGVSVDQLNSISLDQGWAVRIYTNELTAESGALKNDF